MHKGNITAAVLAFALCAAADETIQANGYAWRCSRDGASATITGVTPSSGDISIPESLAAGGSEYPVVGIAESAFAGSAGLTGVEIPYSVTNVSARAFADCPALSCVTVLNPSARIAADAFSNCTAVVAAALPASLTGSASAIFPDSHSVRVYRVDRIDSGAVPAVMRTAKMTGFKATSTPGICRFTVDAKLASGVDATIDPRNFKVIRAATVEALAAMPESAASDDIMENFAARDKISVKLNVRVDPSGDGAIPVTYDEDEKPESESPDKRHFKIVVED